MFKMLFFLMGEGVAFNCYFFLYAASLFSPILFFFFCFELKCLSALKCHLSIRKLHVVE